MSDVKRFRKPEDAKRYVAGCVSALITNGFQNGDAWLHHIGDSPDDDDGNLADLKTEELVQAAAHELEQRLFDYSREKGASIEPTQAEWSKAAWELYAHIHSRGEGPTFRLFLEVMMPLINRAGVKEAK